MKKNYYLFIPLILFCGFHINAYNQNAKTKNSKSLHDKWILDRGNSKISFKVEHMTIADIDGRFKNFKTNLLLDMNNLSETVVDVFIASNSIATGNEERDTHLRSHDFFYCNNFPEIVFRSEPNGLSEIDSTKYKLKGTLQIRDVVQPVELEVKISKSIKDLWGKERIGIRVKGLILREKWGLTLNTILEEGALAIGKEVEITASLQYSK